MPAAWELVPDSERTADAYTTFILFCEDEVNEPSYFRSFQKNQKIKINVVEGQNSSFRNILNTLAYCEKEGLLEPDQSSYRVKPGVTNHLWCVYDRDITTVDPGLVDPQENIAFNFGIQAAEGAGLNVAWSNDVFELWILLHFEDVEPGVWRHRTFVYERLTAIFRALPNQSPEMAAITGRENFSYKIFLKRKAYFLQFVLPFLSPRLGEAMRRAVALEAAFPAHLRQHECNPCTKVHHLVRSILSFS
jgi:hypothetical protein